MAFTLDSLVGDVLDAGAEFAGVFEAKGMNCADCPAARGETLAEACGVHGLDEQALLAELNALARDSSV